MSEKDSALRQNLWVILGEKQAAKVEMATPGLVAAGFNVLADAS